VGEEAMSTFSMFFVYISATFILALWNRKKGHGFWLGFWYSLVLTPAIGLLTIALAQHVVVVDSGNVRRRSCPHCYSMTAANITFCEVCGKHIVRQTVKQYLQMAELFVGLVVTVLIVRSIM
jgi:hypothetical protein